MSTILSAIDDPGNAESGADGPIVSVLDGRYRILLDDPLDAVTAHFARAYPVDDLKDPGRALFALICSPEIPPRVDVAEELRELVHPNLMNTVETGPVALPDGGGKRFCVILERPLGARLMTGPDAVIKPVPERIVTGEILPALVSALSALHTHELTHRAVRPDNIFYDDHERTHIVLGECVSAPPGRCQPLAFEPIERAMAMPSGRGTGTPACDMYALGVTLLALLRGRYPGAGRNSASLLQARIERGSYTALLDGTDLTPQLVELISGLLDDDPSKRWNVEQVKHWPLRARRGLPYTRASRDGRSFTYQGRKYFSARSLGFALANARDAAPPVVRSGEFEGWIRKTLGEAEIADEVAAIVAATGGSIHRQPIGDDEMVARVCLLLDPSGPIRYRNLAVALDGCGPALATAMMNKDGKSLQVFSQMLSLGLPLRALDLQPESRRGLQSWIGLFARLQSYLRDTGSGYGIERCLYELNSHLPCQSPLVVHDYPGDIVGLLQSLDRAAETSASAANPVDRHVAAFAASQLTIGDEEYLSAIPGPRSAREVLYGLTLLSLVQRGKAATPLPHLTRWIRRCLEPAVECLYSRSLRDRISRQLTSSAESGNLRDLHRVVGDPGLYDRDARAYQVAASYYTAYGADIARLQATARRNPYIALDMGQRIAAVISYLALAFSAVLAIGGRVPWAG